MAEGVDVPVAPEAPRGWRATVEFTFAARGQDAAAETFDAVMQAIREIAHPEGGECSRMAPADVIAGSPLAVDIAAHAASPSSGTPAANDIHLQAASADVQTRHNRPPNRLPRLADATLNVLSDCWYWLRRGWAGGAYATPSEPGEGRGGGPNAAEIRTADPGSLGAAAAPETGRARLQHIERTARHALATKPTGTDSWLNGYREDVPWLLADRDKLERALGEAREALERSENDWCFLHNLVEDVAPEIRRALAQANLRLIRRAIIALADSGGEAKAGR